MLVSTEGIVIRNTRYSESSAIVKIYTLSHGMLSFIIPGVYSAKGRIKPSLIQSLQLLELTFYFRENRNLNKVKEMVPVRGMPTLHFDLKKSALAMVVSELVNKTIREEEKNEELYGFLKKAILILENHQGMILNFLVVFMIQLARYLGFYPVNNWSDKAPYFDKIDGLFKNHYSNPENCLDATESKSLGSVLDLPLDRFDRMVLNRNNRQKLIRNMLSYYRIQLDSFDELVSYNVLEKTFA